MKHQQSAVATSPTARKKAPVSAKAKGDGAADPGSIARGDQRDTVIREMAYSFYLERGCVDGHDLEDWLKAESQWDRVSAEKTGVPVSASPSH